MLTLDPGHHHINTILYNYYNSYIYQTERTLQCADRIPVSDCCCFIFIVRGLTFVTSRGWFMATIQDCLKLLHTLYTSEISHNHNLWLTALKIIGRDLVSVYDNLASGGSSDLYSRTTTSPSVWVPVWGELISISQHLWPRSVNW